MNWKKYFIIRIPILFILVGMVFFVKDFPHQWIYLLGVTAVALFDFSLFLNKSKTVAQPLFGFTAFGMAFLGFLAMMKLALFRSDIFNINDVAVQYSLRGFMYIVLSIIGLFSLFSIGINLRKKSNIDRTSSYGILGISILLFAVSYFVFPMFQLFTCGFFVIYLLLLDWFSDRSKSSLVFNFVWVLLFSAFAGMYIYGLTIEKDAYDRHNILNKIYKKHSPDQDNAINRINENLVASDAFEALSDLPLLAKMNRNDYSAFLKSSLNIDKEVYCEAYETNGEGIFTEQFIPLSEQLNTLSSADKIQKHIYFDPLRDGYTLYYQIKNKFRTETLHLFVKIGTNSLDIDAPIKYIVFKDGKNISSNVKNTIPKSIDKLQEIKQDKLSGKYAYVVNHPVDNVQILSYRNIAGINRPLSLFSFILAVSGILFLLFFVMNKYVQIFPDALTTHENNRTSLKGKIQLMVISLITFSFIIIGIVTTYHFQNILAKNRQEQQQQETSIILNHISTLTEGAENNDDALFITNNKLNEIENIYNTPLMVFNPNGDFQAGNTVGINYKMTFNEIRESYKGHEINLSIDNGKWKSVALYAKTNSPYGFLSIGNNRVSDRNEILDFLSTILNIFVFLFMTAGALAIFVSNSITRPITKLGEKIRGFKIGKNAQQLEWQSNDEIGDLIKEYNNLTIKVQESADIIAKTQRDSAWREMAKQVAHEIKNPLTPMKLSIQYLQHQMKNNPERGPELIAKTSKTMEEQINNLTQIANEFSNFAAMPRTENEVVILNEIVEAVHDLFRKREDIDIHLSEPIDDVIVFADHNHIVRILNNLVKNAIQAIPDGKRGVIDIVLNTEQNNALISVKDNGKGVPEHMKNKIFEPNFTTKSSGTGLGLAISANMIESFNGKLYFESEEGIGSTFFMEIPLMKPETPQLIED